MHTAQHSMGQGSGRLRGTGALATPLGESFLSFDVCGDWATQRVALLSGKKAIKDFGQPLGGLSNHMGIPLEAEQTAGSHVNRANPPSCFGNLPTVSTCWHLLLLLPATGIVLAAELNRTLVLPHLLMGGRTVEFGYVL